MSTNVIEYKEIFTAAAQTAPAVLKADFEDFSTKMVNVYKCNQDLDGVPLNLKGQAALQACTLTPAFAAFSEKAGATREGQAFFKQVREKISAFHLNKNI